ncbi:glycoside hydrolase family 43 protein [Niabella terrae]
MIKQFSLLVLICWASLSCSNKAYLFTSFHEPADAGLRLLYSFDGYHWTDLDTVLLRPEVGTQKVMRDPSMVQGPDGTFHLVWTTSWKADQGIGYAASRDLLHWSPQQHIPVMEYEAGALNAWAPELFYDDQQKDYIILWASTIPGRFERGLEPDSNNHRLYYTRTKDFKTFTPTKLYLDPGFSIIDAQIVKRGTNDYVLVLKDNTRPERNVKVAFGNSPMGPWKDISSPITEQFTEGPNTVKVGDQWLIYFDAYRKKTYEALSTRDFKSFESANNKISIPEGHKHGTLVPVKRKFLIDLLEKLDRPETE